MTAPSPDNTLDAIRREIDAIDDQILDLLERRFAAAGRVKATKAGDGSIASSPFRPAREAVMLRRLVAQANGTVPPDALFRLWRVILSASTQFQASVTLHVDQLVGSELGTRLLISQHFCGMKVKLHESPASAIKALYSCRGDLAIVDCTSDWADGFLPEKEASARVIGALPVISDGRQPRLLIFGHAEPQESGEDETLILSPGETPITRAALWQATTGRFTLTSLPGFLSLEDPLLNEIMSQQPDAHIAGRCPRPMKVST
jgi:chorismate mutase/prephenate dehydratase